MQIIVKMGDCNGDIFKTVQGGAVALNISSPTLGITEEDCLKAAFLKLVKKVEVLWENRCSSENSGNTTNPIEPLKENTVDYSLVPVLKTKKGISSNKIETNWKGVEAKDNDEIVRKLTEVYNAKGELVSSSSGDENVFELRPNDYPADVIMKAYVKTEKSGMVVAEKVIRISADEEKEIAPVLEVKRKGEIEDDAIATLNAEVNTLRKLLDLKADK